MDEMPEENGEVEREIETSEESSVVVTRRWESLARRRRILIITVSLLLLLLIIAVLVWRSRKGAETASEETSPVVSVRVARVASQTIARPGPAPGTGGPP